jgi:hypothetical protein
MTMCESRGAVMCKSRIADLHKTGIVTPATPATTPMKSRGTVRAAATAPPIEGLEEGNPTLVWFWSRTRCRTSRESDA